MVSLLPNCKIMKRFKIFFIVLCSVLAAKAQSIVFNNQVPKHEVRAVWLTTIGGIDWPHSYAQSSYSAEKQKKELTDILDRLQQAKINTVLIQTRVRGTMIYPSAYEPWDGCLSGFPGRSPGYDALQKMERTRLQNPQTEDAETHQEDWSRRIHGSGKQSDW